jgi:hypothetical protein
MRARTRAIVVTTTVIGMVVAFALADWPGALLFAAFTGTGSYLVSQRPANSVGWFLMLIGWGLAFGSVRLTASNDALLAGRLGGLEAFSAWANGIGWAFAFIGFFGIAVVFPTGRMPAGPARWPARIGFGGLAVITVLLVFGPVINVTPTRTGIPVDAPNPVALVPGSYFWALVPGPTLLFPVMFLIVLLGIAGLIRRYSRSVGLERLQYRWLVAAIAFVAAADLMWAVAPAILQSNSMGPAWFLVVLACPTVPIAIVVAVLRYRLYDIDRIISRTIAYALVSAVLLGLFGGAVLLLSAALSSVTGGQSIAVAGSTLIAYAAFQPVLGRVRRLVDRRFDRARYDGERTATVFAARVRDETDVDAVVRDLATTTRLVVSPTSLSLWLRRRDVTR